MIACVDCGKRMVEGLGDRGEESDCPECHRCYDCARPDCRTCGPCGLCDEFHGEPWCVPEVVTPPPGHHWNGTQMTKRGRAWCRRMGWLYVGDKSMGADRQQKPHQREKRDGR